MMTATEYPHVEVDDTGRAFVRGTRFKVVQIVKDLVYYRWDAEQIQIQHPMLTLAQVHAALAYYYDHQAELDARLKAEEAADAEFLSTRSPTDLHDRVKQLLAERKAP